MLHCPTILQCGIDFSGIQGPNTADSAAIFNEDRQRTMSIKHVVTTLAFIAVFAFLGTVIVGAF